MFDSIEAHMREGRWHEARRECEEYVARHPVNAQAHAYLGLCYIHFGDIGSAADELKRAFALDPHYWQAAKKLLWCYGRLGRYHDALNVAREVQRLRPSDTEVEREIARLEELVAAAKAKSDPIRWGI